MKVIFLGAPGAGKGTQAENISAKYGTPNISTGVILREAIAEGTKTGLEAKDYMEKGALVPDSIVVDIIKERLSREDCAKGFILDGFPRTIPQAEYLDSVGIKMDMVINISVDDEKIVQRMGGRRVCPKCGASYHTEYKLSSKGDECDKCDGGKLEIRKDDEPSVVKSRLEAYHIQTQPLIEYYSQKGLLTQVVGQEEVADTTKLTVAAIEEYLCAK